MTRSAKIDELLQKLDDIEKSISDIDDIEKSISDIDDVKTLLSSQIDSLEKQKKGFEKPL